MVNYDNLSESASIGVTAVILVIVTCMTIYTIVLHRMNFFYPSAQRFLMIIFTMPIFIGWTTWTELLLEKEGRGVEYLINLFKSLCLASFMIYVERMLGCIKSGSENEFSQDKAYEVLTSLENEFRFLGCFKVRPIQTKDQAKKYLRTVKMLVLQACVLLICLGIAGVIIIGATGTSDLKNGEYSTVFLIFSIINSISSLTALFTLLHYGLYTNKLPQLKNLKVMHKFIIIKLAILFTEVQPLIIQIFSRNGLIANTDKYDVEYITAYTNALLLCSEMIIVSFLLLLIFPLDDYRENLELREKLSN